MLTYLQVLAFKLHSIAFFYLPKLPIKFDSEYRSLQVSYSPLQWAVVLILFTFTWSQALICGYLVLYCGVLKPHKDFGWVRLFIISLCFLMFTLSAILAYSILRNSTRFIGAYNGILQINFVLHQSGNVKTRAGGFDKYGICMVGCVLLGAGCPFAFTFGAIFMNYDTTDYLLKDIIFGDPMYWDMKTIFVAICIRVALLFIVFLEVSRSGSYFICCIFLGADQAIRIVTAFAFLQFENFVQLYNCLRIVHSKIRIWFHWLLYLMETIIFWGTVAACWFVIVGFEKVELPIFLGAVIITVSFVGVQVLLLPDSVDAIIMTEDVVLLQRLSVKIHRAKKKVGGTILHLKVAQSILPIRIICGAFMKINREFLAKHFDLLMTRVFDAILIS